MMFIASFLACLIAPSVAIAAEEPRFTLELEAGPVWQTRNDVQIPNDDTGTRFALDDVAGSGPFESARITFDWRVRERHSVRFLFAPFSITETGALGEDVRFADASFDTDDPVEARYVFDSWRATYRYRFATGPKWTWWGGFTAKVRDAEVRLRQGDTVARDTDTGFVPLGHLFGERRLGERWRFLLELDALAGGPGRAADLSLKLAYDVNDRFSLAGGYRTLEGGADTDDVYSFAWLHYAVVSGIVRF
ncbi:MAG: hypothetical protein AAF690_08755 [Acidobacteriota bacterium]